MEIKLSWLETFIQTSSFSSNGNTYERKYGNYIIDTFPNAEIYWKRFIVPFTNRLIPTAPQQTGSRNNISIDLQELGSYHYSVILNIIFAQKCLIDKQISFFENFYTHLGSICDAVEETVLKQYFMSIEVEQRDSKMLSKLSKQEFLDIAGKWYDDSYHTVYDHYLLKGKYAPFKIPTRSNILAEYFEKSTSYKNYISLATSIRQYRNTIVHNYLIGYLSDNGRHLVPKKEKIGKYKRWQDVRDVYYDDIKRKDDFVVREDQMQNDINELKKVLNSLYEKPIQDMNRLMYENRNANLLEKYDLQLV